MRNVLFQNLNISGKIPVKYHNILFAGTLLVIMIGGVCALIYATPFGPGLINDSVVYIGGAENILAGHGYSRTSGGGEIKPLTVNVPLYSYTLAAVAKIGADLIHAGWLISAICYVINGLLSALLAIRLTRSRFWALLAVLLVATSESVIRAHTFALSEPLFVTFMLAALLLLSYAVESPRWYLIAVTGLVASLAYLTRYIGLSLLATGTLVFFAYSKSWRERFRSIGFFLLFSLPGGIVWVVRNMLITGTAANRSLLYHPLTADKLQEGAQTLLTFLFPDRLNLYALASGFWDGFAILLVFGLILCVYSFWRRSEQTKEKISNTGEKTAFLVSLQAVFYLVVLLLSLTFLDASTALENRILIPAFVCLILIFVYLLHLIWKSSTPRGSWIALGLALITLGTCAYDGRRAVIDLHADGQGYASAYYRNSLTIDALKRLPQVTIWTNRVPAVNLLADRPAYALLAPIDPLTRQKRPNYDSSLQGIRTSVVKGDAILVVFEARQVLEDPIEGQWLKDVTRDIPAIFESEDGMIFAVDKYLQEK